MRLLILNVLAAAILVAGCAPPPPGGGNAVATATADTGTGDKEPGLADIELCDAEEYRPLIGSNIAAVTLPAGPRMRAFSVDDIVTQEYIPQRTNVLYETDGRIIRVYCG